MILVQLLFDLLLKTPNETVVNKIIVRFLRAIQKMVLKFGMPLVNYDLAGTKVRIPLTHDLPFNLKSYPGYSSNVARIGQYAKEKFPDLTFIDIGANVGDTVILARKYCHYPILSIEGDEFYFSLLEKNLVNEKDVTLANAFIGDSNTPKKGSLRRYLGSVRLETGESATTTIDFKTLPEILAEYPQFSRSKFLKIDTDGFDLKILRGAAEFLASAKPILFFEFDPNLLMAQNDDGISVFPFLQSLGYESSLLYDNCGVYLLSLSLSNLDLLMDLHYYFWVSQRYCDICVFHKEDAELFSSVRIRECSIVREFCSKRGPI